LVHALLGIRSQEDLVRYLDFNDSYLAKGETCHPSDNIAAILAAGEYVHASGGNLLTAIAIAYQVQCQLKFDLTASNLLAAVKLCFPEKHPAEFEVSVDQSQKAISIHGINPSLEVVGLRYESQSDGGPVLASFMVSAAPNIVVFSRYAGHHFLSSGYHRVFRLMKAGYSHVPCVVREAKSLAQVSAYGPNAFGDNVLTAPRPPLFVDFAAPVLAVNCGVSGDAQSSAHPPRRILRLGMNGTLPPWYGFCFHLPVLCDLRT